MPSSFGPLVLIARAGRQRPPDLPRLERILSEKRLPFRVHLVGPGEGEAATRAALMAGERFLVAVGGDEMVHEVVNGLFEDDRPVNPNAVLGLVPAGRDADFGRMFGLPEDTPRAAGHLEGPTVHLVDVGKVTFGTDSGGRASRYFANVAEVGFGGAVQAAAARLPEGWGRGRRFAGFWLSLARSRATRLTIEADRRRFEGLGRNVVVANGQFSAGGMKVSPRSWPSDGRLDVLVMTGPRSEAFTLLPRMFRGEHLPHPTIVELKATRVRIEAERVLPIQADGRPLGRTPAVFEVLSEALPIKI